MRIILRDLYGWTEPIDERNWKKLDGLIRERADDRAWPRAVLDRARIERTGTELARRGDGEDDDRLQYALEWGFFTRCQWGEFDTALYELERCWGKSPESPAPIGGGARPATERQIRTLDDVHAAIAHYVTSIPYGRILSTATHLSTDIDYRPVSDDEMAAALARRDQAGPAERDCYASYVNEAFLTALEAHAGEIVFQFSFGAEPLPFETASRLSQRTIGQVAEMIGTASQAAVPVFSGQPACQPVDVHPGARVAELQPGGLLVAQLLSRHDRPGHARAARNGAGQQAGRVLFRRLLRRMVVCQGGHGAQDPGAGPGRADRARAVRPSEVRSAFARAILYRNPAIAAGDRSAA